MTEHYTYLYFDPMRGEPIYVGMGKKARAWAHLKSKKMHPFIQRIAFIRAHGVEPEISFICIEVDRELACLVEQEAIAKFGRKDLSRGPLLNLTDGGEGGLNMLVTEETKKKQSRSMKIANAKPGVNERRAETLRETCALSHIKEQRSATQKLVANDPEVKAKKYSAQKITNATFETKTKRAAGQAQRWADPKARARKSAQTKAYWAAKKAAE